jgi:ABC-type lipoprotein release transport system permease subunit
MKSLLIKLKNINWKNSGVYLIKAGPRMIKYLYVFGSFFFLLIFFAIGKIFNAIRRIPLLGKLLSPIYSIWMKSPQRIYEKIAGKFEKIGNSEIKRSYLISMAYKNLMVKKARSLVTIIGMSAGVGVIVLLLSLGYGIERLVISKVASLDELKIVDVSTGSNTALRLNSKILKSIKAMEKVTEVIPLTSVVGRVTYNNAKTDVVVYGAPNKYLELLKIKIKNGKLFDNNDTLGYSGQSVAGAETEVMKGEYGKAVNDKKVHFNINPEKAEIAWSDCDRSSQILGFVPRIEGGYEGQEFWGSTYYVKGSERADGFDKKINSYVAKWIKAQVPVFYKIADDSLKPVLDDEGMQKWTTACLEETNASIDKVENAMTKAVLGVATSSADLTSLDSSTNDSLDSTTAFSAVVVGSDSAGMEMVELKATAAADMSPKTLTFTSTPSRKALITTGMLALLNIPEKNAVGNKFKVQFIISNSLSSKLNSKAVTSETEYSILGLVDDLDNQYFFIPLGDLSKLNLDNYSQTKVVLSDTSKMTSLRKKIENLGFKTNSTADTVSQIESIFANIRFVLALLGLVALAVASLGMFNTLTVSLLERTREIGGMKTMGMISEEVKDLFLAEAMIMGLSGGVGGLILGFVAGKLISLAISFVALSKGQGFMNLTYVPPFLTIFILIMSFFVGMVTGLYPARRARKISALNALRYE